MSGDNNELVSRLNAVLKNKLTGINQYFLHARMLKHVGNVKLADYEFKSSIDIMKHSDMLVELILSLGGFPNLQELSKLMIGETVESMLANDLALSESGLSAIKESIEYCESQASSQTASATAVILRKIMEGQQEHIDFIHNQLNVTQPTQEKNREKDYA
jgi:bacterioferritin